MKIKNGGNRSAGSVALVVALLACSPAWGQLSEGQKDTIFIGPMKIQPSVEQLAVRQGKELELKRVSQSLETQFINSVSATRVFQLVDRKRLKDLQAEQAFAAVAADPNDKNAARALQMAGARYAFLPEIDGFEDRSETDDYEAIGRSSLTRKLSLSALVQIVNTTTGELLPDVPSVQLEKVETVEMARLGDARGTDQVLVALAREMSARLSQEVIGLLRPAKVLKVTPLAGGKVQILINRGTPAGFKEGDFVEICHMEAVVDEDTGDTYQNKVPLCRAKIVRSNIKQSSAISFGEDLGVTRGCIVELTDWAPEEKPLSPATWSGGKDEVGTAVAPRAASPDTPGSSAEPLDWGK